ncbi:MAG TPA: 16S rRNA (guanine(527)-N(7))-methyltransferase RsmG [Pyrinomonadaceae bacterium]|nr:16S rRNA (guanine(527)-N(7))-methyltransferase RsmG [Pyrinomonadaceae bacterium]
MAEQLEQFREALTAHAEDYHVALTEAAISQLSNYYALLITWNPRLHLVAPCSPAEFATRHVLESLMLLPHLANNDFVADIGTGGGLPIIPNLILRSDLRGLLIESSHKKSVFLREVLRTIGASERTQIISERFQDVPAQNVNAVTCRALDQFLQIFDRLLEWAPANSKLLLFGGEGLKSQIEKACLEYSAVKLPHAERRFLFVTQR